MDNMLKEYSVDYRLTAAGCTAQGELPLSTLIRQIIEIATSHANILGIGYKDLIKNRSAWVLGRLNIDLKRLPSMHEDYSLTTWIEAFNRHYSIRNFVIQSKKDGVIGYSSTVWMAINIDTRRPTDLSIIENREEMILGKDCPVSSQFRIPLPKNSDIENLYQFKTTDIDFNRHVTTCRYVDLVQNQLPLDFYDYNSLKYFEIAFHHEGIWGETVKISSEKTGNGELLTAIVNSSNVVICSNRMTFRIR